MTDPADRVVRTQCASNCGGRSALECHVVGGRLRHVRPGPVPDDAYAGVCVRCLLLPEWVYSADRLLAPMRRVAGTPRGPAAEFETISWDTALDAVAGAMSEARQRHGEGSVGFARTSGASSLGDYRRLGALLQGANLFGGVDMAVHMGLNAVLGDRGMYGQSGNEWTDRVNARTALVWGNNPAETSMTSFRHLLDAQKAGTRIVVIDPRYSATAVHADWWIAPRPGTDLALVLGMLHVALAEGLVDAQLLKRATTAPAIVRPDGRLLVAGDVAVESDDPDALVVVDSATGGMALLRQAIDPELEPALGHGLRSVHALVKELVEGFDPDTVGGITGLASSDVRDLALLYASDRPATIGFGYGVDRYPAGDRVTHAAAILAFYTGNFGVPGSGVGVQSHGKGYHTADLGPDMELPADARMRSLPNAIAGRTPSNVRVLFNCGDWINQRIADLNTVVEWIASLDLVVTVDHVWNTSCGWSDIILPASTFVEGFDDVRDVVTAGNAVHARSVVIPPVGDSLPDMEIERRLAQRLGFGSYFEVSTEERIDRQLASSGSPHLRNLTVQTLLAAGGSVRFDVPSRPLVQFEDLRFRTRSGRAELYLEAQAPIGHALPRWDTNMEALRQHPAARRFPLVMVQAHVRHRSHATFVNCRWMLELWPEPVLEISPVDAAARDIADGSLVEIYNDRGSVVVRASLNGDFPPGLCSMAEGWQDHHYVKGNMQTLTNPTRNTSQEHLWGYGNIPHNDTRVEVRPWASDLEREQDA